MRYVIEVSKTWSKIFESRKKIEGNLPWLDPDPFQNIRAANMSSMVRNLLLREVTLQKHWQVRY